MATDKLPDVFGELQLLERTLVLVDRLRETAQEAFPAARGIQITPDGERVLFHVDGITRIVLAETLLQAYEAVGGDVTILDTAA